MVFFPPLFCLLKPQLVEADGLEMTIVVIWRYINKTELNLIEHKQSLINATNIVVTEESGLYQE